MKHILCPTDFSKAATNAISFAAMIAAKTGAALTLLHVAHLPILDSAESALVAGEVVGEQKRHATDKLHALARHLQEVNGSPQLQIDTLVEEDLLVDAIKKLTKDGKYGLVVIGSTGGGNTLEEILIGSNTEAVIEQVSCPVLSVPLKAAIMPFRQIVYASDYHEKDSQAIRQVQAFAQLFGASLEIVHVSAKASTDSDSKANNFRRQLQSDLGGEELQFHEVVHPDEVTGMKDYLTARQADLLAILKKRHGFFNHLFSQSFSEKLTYQGKLPMLFLHE